MENIKTIFISVIISLLITGLLFYKINNIENKYDKEDQKMVELVKKIIDKNEYNLKNQDEINNTIKNIITKIFEKNQKIELSLKREIDLLKMKVKELEKSRK